MTLLTALKVFIALGCANPNITTITTSSGIVHLWQDNSFSGISNSADGTETKLEKLNRELLEEKARIKKEKDCTEAFEVISK